MDCLHLIAPDDEELLNFALDEEPLEQEKMEHLARCVTCQQRLAQFKLMDSALSTRLYRSQCPDGSQLSLYCADLLPPDERMEVARHIHSCPLCTAEVADTRRFFAEVEPVLPVSFSLGDSVRRVFASLVRQQVQLVTRSEHSRRDWPRQYQAEDIDLSLHLSCTSKGDYMLLGILTSSNDEVCVDAFEGSRAALYAAPYDPHRQEARPLCYAMIDDLGNIVFNAVPVGEYVLTIHLPEREIVIEDITIERC